jgi:hypothetical protein
MTEAVEPDRLAAARLMMSILRESPSVRESVAAHESGERPILVASIDDPLEDVVERIHGVGLPVTLCVLGGSASMTVMTVRADVPEQEAGWESAPPNATIGMIVAHFWLKSSASFRVPDLAANRELALQLA